MNTVRTAAKTRANLAGAEGRGPWFLPGTDRLPWCRGVGSLGNMVVFQYCHFCSVLQAPTLGYVVMIYLYLSHQIVQFNCHVVDCPSLWSVSLVKPNQAEAIVNLVFFDSLHYLFKTLFRNVNLLNPRPDAFFSSKPQHIIHLLCSYC